MTVDLNQKLIAHDGILWELHFDFDDVSNVTPLCPKDRFSLTVVYGRGEATGYERTFQCDECGKEYVLLKTIDQTITYFDKKFHAERLAKHKVLNIDDGFYLVAKDDIEKSDDHPYWAKVRLYEGQKGPLLKILAVVTEELIAKLTLWLNPSEKGSALIRMMIILMERLRK